MTIALDSHWIPTGFPLEFTPAKAGVGMTIATGNDKRGGNDNCNRIKPRIVNFWLKIKS